MVQEYILRVFVVCFSILALISVVIRVNTVNHDVKSIETAPRYHFEESAPIITADNNIRKLDEVKITYDLEKAKLLANNILNLIYNRYEMYDEPGSQFFLTANNYGSFHWDILKYKYAKRALEGGKTYLMIFGGSSVTAGHDNYFNQSYPMIVRSRMESLFQALGIELIVHNIAQGANNCIPYTFCYESMGGLDPDFVGWEQSYNCGRDEAVFELVARIAGYSKNHAMTYYSASGAWLPECPESRDHPPFCSESWTPDNATLFAGENITSTGDNALPKLVTDKAYLDRYRTLINEYHEARPTASRFMSYADIIKSKDYHAVAPHGFNVWEPNPHCKYIKNGKSETNCNGIDSTMGCKMRFMTHEASIYGSDNGGGARWHPSRAFHLLRGEAITWLYTLPLLDAVYMLESDFTDSANTKASLIERYGQELDRLHPSTMPKPKKCHNYLCAERPICYTNFLPHYSSNMTLSELIVGTHNWTLDDNEYHDWSKHYGFLDLKPTYIAIGPGHSEISIRIHIGKVTQVGICGQSKESLLHTHIHLDPNITFAVDSNTTSYTPSSNRILWTKKKYIGNECKFLEELPVGDHVLNIAPKPTNSDKHRTGLSHVIMWP